MNRYGSYYPMQNGRRGRMMPGARNDMPSTPMPTPPVTPPAAPDCGCSNETGCSMDALPVAMAYVSWQNWQTPYDTERALCRGTIFPCLDLPFLAYRGATI